MIVILQRSLKGKTGISMQKKSRLCRTWKITGRIMKSHLRDCRKIVRNQKVWTKNKTSLFHNKTSPKFKIQWFQYNHRTRQQALHNPTKPKLPLTLSLPTTKQCFANGLSNMVNVSSKGAPMHTVKKNWCLIEDKTFNLIYYIW
jgi:hypothetical protein